VVAAAASDAGAGADGGGLGGRPGSAQEVDERKGNQCPEVMEQARLVASGAVGAGWADRLRPDRADSASVPSAATRFPMWPGSLATSRLARSVEQR